LQSEEQFIVGRGNLSFLRIWGKEPHWEMVTATAGEDDGTVHVFPDRELLNHIACEFARSINKAPILKKDRFGRSYVKIGALKQQVHEPDDKFNHYLGSLIRQFFDVFDSSLRHVDSVGDEMTKLYHDLSDDTDADFYLSDGVWLSKEGFVSDRGR
jgi:hypothetical protein